MLTKEEVFEFKQLYAEEFGEILSDQEAHDLAIELVTFFETVDDIHQRTCTGCPMQRPLLEYRG